MIGPFGGPIVPNVGVGISSGTLRSSEPYAIGPGPWPSLWWYLKQVRPKIDPSKRFGGVDAPVFLYVDHKTGDARSWFGNHYTRKAEEREKDAEHAFSVWVGKRIRAVLGPGAPGPHLFRRACATFRVREGWSIEAVSAFLDDTKSVVEASYVDRRFLNFAGVNRPPRGVDRPLLPRLQPGSNYGIRPPANVPDDRVPAPTAVA